MGKRRGNGWLSLKKVRNKFSARKKQYIGHFWQKKFSSAYYKGNKAFYKENQHKIWDFSRKVGLTEPIGEKPTGNDCLTLTKVTNKFSAQKKQYKGHFGQNKFSNSLYKGNFNKNVLKLTKFQHFKNWGGKILEKFFFWRGPSKNG